MKISRDARFLLDTNVISESAKASSAASVRRFFEQATTENLFLSVLTIGELRRGLAMRQRQGLEIAERLAAWIDRMEKLFAGHILDIDLAVAQRWAEFTAQGGSRPVVDTLIAASAAVHDLTVVTRNVRDFEGLPVRVLNPWVDETRTQE